MSVRTFLAIAAIGTLVGCETPSYLPVGVTPQALEQRITPDEARAFVLSGTQRALEVAQAHEQEASANTRGDDVRLEVKTLKAYRGDRTSRLNSFLAHSHPSDEIWLYRTHTPTGRQSQIGLALLRKGRIIGCLAVAICD